MAKDSPKGSIIYKLIIVILAAALIATILYPKSLWKKEEANKIACRQNMEHIMSAELLYMMNYNNYSDTLGRVVDFIKSDTTGNKLLEYLKLDSILSLQVVNTLRLKDTLGVTIDSMKAFCKATGVDTVEEFIIDSLHTFSRWAAIIDSMTQLSLDSLFKCPTIQKPYQLTVIDTSVIKIFQVFCPIDSLDSLKVAYNFKKSKLGALRIKNHGNIDGGTKSWK